MSKKVELGKFKLNNVRLSFPSIFHRGTKKDGTEGKFEATFLINKETQANLIAEVEKQIEIAKASVSFKIPSDKLCLRDGDDFEYDGYANHMAFKSSSNKRITIIDRDRTPLVEDDPNAPYAGCYVNAIVGLWIQNNEHGKRLNANLYGIQFVKDGEAFGSGQTDVTEMFENLDELY